MPVMLMIDPKEICEIQDQLTVLRGNLQGRDADDVIIGEEVEIRYSVS